MSSKVVVDSSVAVKWLNDADEKDIEQANKLLVDALNENIILFMPELAKYEIGNVLLLKKKLSVEEIEIPIQTFYSFPIQFISESEELAKDTYNVAFKLGITYYDASFISLAKLNNAILITENIKHQGKSVDIEVKSLKDY
jgi:predicted nucleic acid-binding protein